VSSAAISKYAPTSFRTSIRDAARAHLGPAVVQPAQRERRRHLPRRRQGARAPAHRGPRALRHRRSRGGPRSHARAALAHSPAPAPHFLAWAGRRPARAQRAVRTHGGHAREALFAGAQHSLGRACAGAAPAAQAIAALRRHRLRHRPRRDVEPIAGTPIGCAHRLRAGRPQRRVRPHGGAAPPRLPISGAAAGEAAVCHRGPIARALHVAAIAQRRLPRHRSARALSADAGRRLRLLLAEDRRRAARARLLPRWSHRGEPAQGGCPARGAARERGGQNLGRCQYTGTHANRLARPLHQPHRRHRGPAAAGAHIHGCRAAVIGCGGAGRGAARGS